MRRGHRGYNKWYLELFESKLKGEREAVTEFARWLILSDKANKFWSSNGSTIDLLGASESYLQEKEEIEPAKEPCKEHKISFSKFCAECQNFEGLKVCPVCGFLSK